MNKYITSTFLEYPDNYSIATIIYFKGCDRNCLGCHNTNLKEYNIISNNLINEIVSYCNRIKTNKIVLCGGDPLYIKNLEETKNILYKLGNTYDICIYTGANIEEVKKLNLSCFKYIKCGIFDNKQYIGSKKTDEYIQFATKNQKLYDSNLNLLSKDGVFYF